MFPYLLKGIALASLILDAAASEPTAPSVQPLQLPGLHNVFSLSSNVFSGSSPQHDQDFGNLAKLGVKTIISVDGARPNTQAARKHGLRYVHLPHRYDGIPSDTQARLAKAALTLDPPIYIHCHHGAHRGPAAAAILCMTREGWSPSQAEAWLRLAGTSSNYAGLFRSIREFKTPDLASVPADFPETSEVSSLTIAMTKIDHQFDRLKLIQKANFTTPAEHPDLVPANELLILREHYRELQRLPEVQSAPKLLAAFAAAETEARETEQLLRSDSNSTANQLAQLERSFQTLARRCASCHGAHRDNR